MENTNDEHDNNRKQEQEYRAQNGPLNLDDLQKKWNEIQKEYRKKYPSLTSEDVDYRSGEFTLMTERVAKRTNRSQEEIQKEIKNWD
ncbi:hypothetical protein BN863_12620 [Formosa agariphila KMM 3901]|uniref:Uncharacterized protein n=1 Tax=Formosa agariphila (strain DSM 15362 / KCTC 12365 / LMG 23005 / KMM 3901 / M-2Alg 35-1) TaxID=1347342 RepID=T2KLU9_FORAG|nr:hypothetical protein [Formosa agariphila]CDF78974.1 hypothetical protein BN863_12620 [Formosa agariphila KMM 3901]